jgi:hypothetical protein
MEGTTGEFLRIEIRGVQDCGRAAVEDLKKRKAGGQLELVRVLNSFFGRDFKCGSWDELRARMRSRWGWMGVFGRCSEIWFG